MRRRSRVRTTVPVAVAAACLIAGCTSSDDGAAPSEPTEETTTEASETSTATSPETPETPTSAGSESTTSPASPPPSPTTAPQSPSEDTESASTATPTDPPATSSGGSGGSGVDSRPSRARRSLIPAAQLPGFNDTWVWDRSTTTVGSSGGRPPGVCLQTSMTAIGGFAEARRDYSSSLTDDAEATVISVVFPDAETARSAVSVLEAWQRRCAAYAQDELNRTKVRVSAAEPVRTVVGPAMHWLVTHGPAPGRRSSWFDAEGYVVDGDTLSYAVIRVVSQDYNYPPGRSPVEQTLRVAGARLARTR